MLILGCYMILACMSVYENRRRKIIKMTHEENEIKIAEFAERTNSKRINECD